jgi:hypothetical protein
LKRQIDRFARRLAEVPAHRKEVQT